MSIPDIDYDLDDDYEIKSWMLGNDTDCDTCGMSWNEAQFDPHFSGQNRWSFHYRVGCYSGDSVFWDMDGREEKLEEMFADLRTYPGWPRREEAIVREMIEECDILRVSDGMADTDLAKPIRLSLADWEQLNQALEGEQK